MIRRFSWLVLVCLLPVLGRAQGPTCTAVTMTPSTITVGQSTFASGSCTAGTAPIISITINWGDQGGFSVVPVNDPNNPTYSVPHTYTVAGTFIVTVTATDANNVPGVNTGMVTVNQAPPPPTGPTCTITSVNPTSGTAPLQVTVHGDCEPGSNPLQSVTLDWGDNTGPVNEPAGAFTDQHTYVTPRNRPYTITLNAMDSAQMSATPATATVDVNAPQPQAPTCSLNLSTTSGSVPLALTAGGSCTDPQGALTGIVLDWGDGNQTNIPVTNPGTTQFGPVGHTYVSQGTFHPTVTATDGAGLQGSATKNVSVGAPVNLPPSCTLSLSANSGQVPLTVTASANCIDPENDINSVIFSFGDGYYQAGSAGQSSATHTFVNGGMFPVQVVATDTGGNVASVQQNVNPSDNPPVFVAVSNGQVKQFAKDGTPLQPTLSTNQSGSTTGMAQDSMLNLYVTDFTANAVTRFGGHGGLIGNFGSGYNCKPESIVFDASGNAYVGETGCSHAVLKFDAYGNLVATYSVATQTEGSDWIDLAPDQCTLYYTSQGSTVLRFNLCTNKQLSTFASGLNTALGVRVLPDNTVVVAEKSDIVRLDASGHPLKTYDAAGHDCWVSVALDSDGTSLWGVDYCTSDVMRFDISSGNQRSTFNSGTPANTAFGVYTRGPNAAPNPAGPLVGPARAVTVSAGQSATYNLTFLPNFNGTFTFSCANLPLGARCSFAPPTVAGTPGATPVVLTVSTTGPTASLVHSRMLFYATWLPMLGVFVIAAGATVPDRKRHLRLAVITGLLLVGLILLVACGGGSSSSSNNNPSGSTGSTTPPTPGTSTPPGTYTFSVTAGSGSNQSSTALILTVQ